MDSDVIVAVDRSLDIVSVSLGLYSSLESVE